MTDTLATNLFASPFPHWWYKKVSRQTWNFLGRSMISATTKLLFSNFEKQTSPSQILKKETPFVSTPLSFFLVTIKKADARCLVWMKRSIFSTFVLQGLSLKFWKTKLLLSYSLVFPSSLIVYRERRSVRCESSNTAS